MLTSLDGYVNDADGRFECATPDEELHAYINSVSRSVGTCLLGRRMYETMVFWADPRSVRGEPALMVEYAEIWQGYDKVVYSTTLAEVASEGTRSGWALSTSCTCTCARSLWAAGPRSTRRA
jgi:hypothetical protein